MTSAEQLILRGLHIMMRASFSPNTPEAQAAHFMKLQHDIGPWMIDYVTEMEKPVVDFTLTPIPPSDAGGGVQQ